MPGSLDEFSFPLTSAEVGDLIGARAAAEPVAELFGPSRKAKMEALLKCLYFDEESGEAVIAMPGTCEVQVLSERDPTTGVLSSWVRVRPTALAQRSGHWLRRTRAQKPLALTPNPPAPTEGFGRLRPVPT